MYAQYRVNQVVVSELAENWAKDHAGYYGKPCGRRSPTKLERLEDFQANFFDDDDFGLSSAETIKAVHCGYNKLNGWDVWIKAYGTWVAVHAEESLLMVGGHRHAIAPMVSDSHLEGAELLEIVSQQPERGLLEFPEEAA